MLTPKRAPVAPSASKLLVSGGELDTICEKEARDMQATGQAQDFRRLDRPRMGEINGRPGRSAE